MVFKKCLYKPCLVRFNCLRLFCCNLCLKAHFTPDKISRYGGRGVTLDHTAELDELVRLHKEICLSSSQGRVISFKLP